MMQREKVVAKRLTALGLSHVANEAMLSMLLEIDRKFGGGPKLNLGEVSYRTELAKDAFGAAVLNSDDLNDRIAAARKAAGL
jgi:hypothetical protein